MDTINSSILIKNRYDYKEGILTLYGKGHIYYFNINNWILEDDMLVLKCIRKTTKKHNISNSKGGKDEITLKMSELNYKRLVDYLTIN